MARRSGAGNVFLLALLLVGLFVIPMFGMTMWRPMMMGGGMMGGWSCPAGFGWGYPTGMGWGFMLTGMLAPLLFIALLIVGAYFLLTPRSEMGANERSLSILDERYARGEITKEQYLEMKKELKK